MAKSVQKAAIPDIRILVTCRFIEIHVYRAKFTFNPARMIDQMAAHFE
jgi:hypothetical protein